MRRLFLFTLCLAVSACGRSSPPDRDAETAASPADPRVETLVAAVSEERLSATLKQLVSFDTRFTASNPDAAGKGIGAARQWILDELKRASPKLQVSFDSYKVAAQGERILKDVELRNVMAVLPGRSPRRIYVTAHYDSLARVVNPPPEAGPPTPAGFHWNITDNVAPGANDDGSGTALTIELARVFAQSGIDFDATLVFLAFAGEEEGLLGAHLHAEKARTEKAVIDAVFNNDIVGGVSGGTGLANTDTVRVFSEGPEDSPSRQLARHIRKTAERYVPDHRVLLIPRYDRFSRGGDHIAFNDRGVAAIRFTEAHENYQRQHRVEDTLEGVSFPYLARNARVNAAGVATLALAPPAPVVTTATGLPMLARGATDYDYDARLRWNPSPGAVSYRVYSRQAWLPDWEQTVDVGNVTEYLRKNVSIDDYVFGVSAVSADGNESLVSAYVNRPRQPVTVKTLPN